MYSPKIHWHAWECGFYDKQDNFTNRVGMVTCQACKKKLHQAESVKLAYPFRKKDIRQENERRP